MTLEEIEYARQDVRCTAALLNVAKEEFDKHPIPLDPYKAYSPASRESLSGSDENQKAITQIQGATQDSGDSDGKLHGRTFGSTVAPC